MWVYWFYKNANGDESWMVGWYDREAKEHIVIETYPSLTAAREAVHYLNGGN